MESTPTPGSEQLAIRPAPSTALSPAGTALVASVEGYLADRTQPTAPSPAPGAGVFVGVEAVEQLLSSPAFRDRADQLGYVPAASTAWLLEQAVQLLRQHGWIRGTYQSGAGYCLTGALEEAARAAGVAWEVHRAATLAVELTLAALTPSRSVNLIGWNDHLSRRDTDVLGLLASSVVVAWRFGGNG